MVESIQPEAVFDRRALCQSAALLPFAALLPPVARSASFSPATDYDAFVRGLDQLKNSLPPRVPALENAYVHSAAARALQVEGFPVPRLFPMGSFRGVEIGPLIKAEPFLIIRYRLAPGAVLPPHDHPNYSVATVGLSGEALVSQFEIAGQAPAHGSPGKFALWETSRRSLVAGDVVTLSPSRDNIHTFCAGASGAEFVDVTTAHGPDEGFSYLNIAPTPFGEIDDLHSATWTKFQ